MKCPYCNRTYHVDLNKYPYVNRPYLQVSYPRIEIIHEPDCSITDEEDLKIRDKLRIDEQPNMYGEYQEKSENELLAGD